MQTPLLHSRLLTVRFLPQFGLPIRRGLFCFLVGLLSSPSLLAQTISTVAGGGSITTDGGPAINASLDFPSGVAFDAGGNPRFKESSAGRNPEQGKPA